MSSEQLPEEITNQIKRLGLTEPVWNVDVTPEQIQYFLDRWPFLQILSSNKLDSFEKVKVETAKTNWTILNYGDALASSPGAYLLGGGDFRIDLDEEDDDGGEIVNPGKGTIWRQAVDTAVEMVQLARKMGWSGVHIVDGHPLMKWAAWSLTLDEDILLTGFEPSQKDHDRRERMKRSELEDIKRFSKHLTP